MKRKRDLFTEGLYWALVGLIGLFVLGGLRVTYCLIVNLLI